MIFRTVLALIQIKMVSLMHVIPAPTGSILGRTIQGLVLGLLLRVVRGRRPGMYCGVKLIKEELIQGNVLHLLLVWTAYSVNTTVV